jgi:uncharacterized protein YbbK (DUF523 family)
MKIMISACLLGQEIRYDGKDNLRSFECLQRLFDEDKVVAFCPEVEGGLPIPRSPAEIQNKKRGYDVLFNGERVMAQSGKNVTDEFIRGAYKALQVAQKNNIKVAILKARSPSCSSSLVYDGSFSKTLVEGMGVSATLLNLNGIKIFDEEHIEEAFAAFRALEKEY